MTMSIEEIAKREYEAAYQAHKITTAKYRAGKIDDEAFVASFNLLKERRDRHELFLFSDEQGRADRRAEAWNSESARRRVGGTFGS